LDRGGGPSARRVQRILYQAMRTCGLSATPSATSAHLVLPAVSDPKSARSRFHGNPTLSVTRRLLLMARVSQARGSGTAGRRGLTHRPRPSQPSSGPGSVPSDCPRKIEAAMDAHPRRTLGRANRDSGGVATPPRRSLPSPAPRRPPCAWRGAYTRGAARPVLPADV
jgi:hypothetical protein